MINWKENITPAPPYIASIFNYYLSSQLDGCQEYDELTLAMAKQMPGYLGYKSFKEDGRGTFINCWKDMGAVRAWAMEPKHIEAKQKRQVNLIPILSQCDSRGQVNARAFNLIVMKKSKH